MKKNYFSTLLIVFIISLYTNSIFAQGGQINLNKLIEETQKLSEGANEMTIVWWIPEEFWIASFSQDTSITKTQIEEFLKILRPFTVVVVVDGTVGAFGGITYRTESTIRADVEIKDSKGISYRPISGDEIDSDAQNFLSMMKPVFVNMLGQMGENMHFILFPSMNKTGQNITNPMEEGSFSVMIGEREFKWRLPLGSLLPLKMCPKCGEKLIGSYKFCPWDGTKL